MSSELPVRILKFGGSSVGSPENLSLVADIVMRYYGENPRLAVVVSAFGKTTDELINIARKAQAGEWEYVKAFQELEKRHLKYVFHLFPDGQRQSDILANVKYVLGELRDILQGIYLIKELTARILDTVMSFGERISAYILSEVMKDKGVAADFLDARLLVKTDSIFGSASVDYKTTYENIETYFKQRADLQIITGFIASNNENQTTTLGRGGSDYTAAIFGAGLKVEVVEIWTDVDGVMTADPRVVSEAFSMPEVTYAEAMEMSHFGAKVIYPPTIQPLVEQSIPILVKNTFNPDFPGTVIQESALNDYIVRGISSIENVVLLRLEGSGMVGVPGISMRLFGALARNNISVILISQASSEHSICFAIHPASLVVAQQAIEEEFSYEMQKFRIDPVVVQGEVSIIAVVGQEMRQRSGVAGRLFAALGQHRINVVAIAQGSSELNISLVVERHEMRRAVNVIHEAFFRFHVSGLDVFVLGTGAVGGALLDNIGRQQTVWHKNYNFDFSIQGIGNTNKMFFPQKMVNIAMWPDLLNGDGALEMNLDEFMSKIKQLNRGKSVFVDCTGSEEVVKRYPELLREGISIVTPNKKANVGPIDFYLELRNLSRKYNVQFLYETNVGAALPILGTLRDMILGGDEIMRIEGILSGTLSYIFNTFDGTRKFSAIVREAWEKRYTEPDPRDDLGGQDVMRKLVILAREAGVFLECGDVVVESLLPEGSRNCQSVEEFLNFLGTYDRVFEGRLREAAAEGQVLRYVASLEDGKASVALKKVGKDHLFYNLRGCDNMVVFFTKNYTDTPLIIRGPGAGGTVTAAGVLADILRIGGLSHPRRSEFGLEREHEGLGRSNVKSQRSKILVNNSGLKQGIASLRSQ